MMQIFIRILISLPACTYLRSFVHDVISVCVDLVLTCKSRKKEMPERSSLPFRHTFKNIRCT